MQHAEIKFLSSLAFSFFIELILHDNQIAMADCEMTECFYFETHSLNHIEICVRFVFCKENSLAY